MSEHFVGEIRMFAGNFAPRGWAFCDGQILPINQNQSLYSLLGTTFGGDGRTTFALPDLRGRSPYHAGDGSFWDPSRFRHRLQKGGDLGERMLQAFREANARYSRLMGPIDAVRHRAARAARYAAFLLRRVKAGR